MSLNKTALAEFKAKLDTLEQELLALQGMGKDAAKTVELDQSRLGRLSRMDALQGQAMSQAVNERRQVELQKISAALRRIDSGHYGYCIKCDESISQKRLEFDPAAPLCIDCASRLER